MTSHIAQLNIGRFRYSTDDPRMAAFISNLDRVNALAERSEGFVLRLKDESNNATAIFGHIPDLAEAMARLEHLRAWGDSDFAFGWSHLPHIKLWMSRKCG